MTSVPGADRPAPPEESGVAAAASEFSASLVRFMRALTGLFGLELRESGAQALVLALLAVALIVCCFLAYLFLIVGAAVYLVGQTTGGWKTALVCLFLLHVLMAIVLGLVLRMRARLPLFSGTREAVRREMDRLS
ncbi:MAG: phage holin family protein [Chthoniobacterales bacterium]|jgi:uncharacterized membrane protein YqjE